MDSQSGGTGFDFPLFSAEALSIHARGPLSLQLSLRGVGELYTFSMGIEGLYD